MRRLFLFFFLLVVSYLGLYTINLRTGVFDKVGSYVGLDSLSLIFKPVQDGIEQIDFVLNSYFRLVDVEKENNKLRIELARANVRQIQLFDRAEESLRLQKLLNFSAVDNWTMQGARIVIQKLGTAALLDTCIIDKGAKNGIKEDMPVTTPEGVIGRVLRTGLHSSIVLLLQDPNSRIPVRGKDSRTTGLLVGTGLSKPLEMRFVELNDTLKEGEILVTSGLGGVFPKELPVGVVSSIKKSNIDLFQTVEAQSLVSVKNREEVFLLERAVDYNIK